MKPIRSLAMSAIAVLFLFTATSMVFGQPLPCTEPAPHVCIRFNPAFDDDLDGDCNEDPINGEDDDRDGVTDEDPFPPMCDWQACIDTDCSNYTLKYFRNIDLTTPNANIIRAIIVHHGGPDYRVSVDDRPHGYYMRIYNAAVDLGLLNQTLILAPFFDLAKKCQVNLSNECLDDEVDNPKCGGNTDSDGRLCWRAARDLDSPAGGNAENDDHLRTSSYMLMDNMINTLAELKNTGIFPNLNTIVITGQSKGGIFTLTYAMVGVAKPEGISVRYLPCNATELPYLNQWRPTDEAKQAFPNIGYDWDCDNDGTPERHPDPADGVTVDDCMADTEDWKTYPFSFEIPPASYKWEDENDNDVYCVANNSYDEWPFGISNVPGSNVYMVTEAVTPAQILTNLSERDITFLYGIDDNQYGNKKTIYQLCEGNPPGWPAVWSCMLELQGQSRLERGAFFYRHVCCSSGCDNFRMETVCIDDCTDVSGDGTCDIPAIPPDTPIADGICDGSCLDANDDCLCDNAPPDPLRPVRLNHGRRIYDSAATRQAVFFINQPTQWGKTLGGLENEQAVAVEKTQGGGYVVLGETDSYGAGKKDFWIVKLDDAGTMLWQNTYGGPENESAAAITASPDGGYLVVGSTDSVTSGGEDAWMLKIDEHGTAEWGRSYGGPLNDSGVAVVTSNDCKYVIGGTTHDPDTGNSDIWLMKWDSNDGVLWHKTYYGSTIETLTSFQRTWDGGFIVAGETNYFPERNTDFRVLKVDKDGLIEWDKAYGLDVFVTPGAPRNENGEYSPSIRQTRDGGYILAGTTEPHTGKHMVWLLKLTSDGSISWEKLFSPPGDCDLSSILQADDNGYLLSGDTGATGDGWMMKLDENGVKEWSNYYGGEGPALRDTISFFHKASDGGYIAVGYTQSLAASDEDLWILKVDENGQIPECPAIRAGFLAAEDDPSEEPVGISSAVDEESYSIYSWSATVTQPPLERVFEWDGCTPNALDLIDLPRTGQTIAYRVGDDGHNQAGVAWPSPRFFDNEDGTVTDDLTGLMWLKDANCANSAGYDPNDTGNGRVAWQRALDFVAGINDRSIDISPCSGYSQTYDDWRLANVNEMESLIHAGVTDRAGWLNSQGFHNVQDFTYWTSTPTPGYIYQNYAYVAELSTSRIRSRYQGSEFYAWTVRAGQQDYPDPNYPANVWRTGRTGSRYAGDDGETQAGVVWPSNRFIDNWDGTVTDALTGLVWLQDASCLGVREWHDAVDTVADFNINPAPYDCLNYTANNVGWRLPNRKEVRSLVDHQRDNPALPEGHAFENLPNSGFLWTSNTEPTSTNQAWTFDLLFGNMQILTKWSWTSTVWPVRRGIHGVAVRDADLDRDGDVDGRDLHIFQAAFGSHRGDGNFDPRADMVVDEVIDQADLQTFTLNLGQTDCPCM